MAEALHIENLLLLLSLCPVQISRPRRSCSRHWKLNQRILLQPQPLGEQIKKHRLDLHGPAINLDWKIQQSLKAAKFSRAEINANIRARGASHSDRASHVRHSTWHVGGADSPSVPQPTPRKFRSIRIRRQPRRSPVPVRRPRPFPLVVAAEPAGQLRCRPESHRPQRLAY